MFTCPPHFPRCYIKCGPPDKTEIPPKEEPPDRRAWKHEGGGILLLCNGEVTKTPWGLKRQNSYGEISAEWDVSWKQKEIVALWIWYSEAAVIQIMSPSETEQPLKLHMFPNSQQMLYNALFVWNWKGRFFTPSPSSYTNAINLLSHRKRERKEKKRESDQ